VSDGHQLHAVVKTVDRDFGSASALLACSQCACVVLAPLVENFDIILGRIWLTSHSSIWDFPAQTLALKASPQAPLTILNMSCPSPSPAPPISKRIISPRQVRREQVRGHGATLFHVFFEHFDAAFAQVPELAQPTLRDFQDVFDEPRPGIPPVRVGIDHTIDL
jgi:hypothetical protein